MTFFDIIYYVFLIYLYYYVYPNILYEGYDEVLIFIKKVLDYSNIMAMGGLGGVGIQMTLERYLNF